MAHSGHTLQISPAIIISFILHLLVQCPPGGTGATRTVHLKFTLLASDTNTGVCDVGLTNPGIYLTLEYRETLLSQWQGFFTISMSAKEVISCDYKNISVDIPLGGGGGVLNSVQFRLIQMEHGGGYCNCWGLVPGSWTVQLDSHDVPPLTM